MSREGAGDKRPKPQPKAGTPIWVWLIYGLGILAAAIVAFSVLFTAGALLLSDDVPVTLRRVAGGRDSLGRPDPRGNRDLVRATEAAAMRLGRISYVNMAPVFYGLEVADVEEISGRSHRARAEAARR